MTSWLTLQYLATPARKNLSVPATSAQAERVFSWMEWLLKKEDFVCQNANLSNLSTYNYSWRTVLGFRLLLSLQCVFDNKLTPFISGNQFSRQLDSYFSLLNLSFVENNHISISTTFAKQSMINRLSNHINRNRSAPKISKVMSSSREGQGRATSEGQAGHDGRDRSCNSEWRRQRFATIQSRELLWALHECDVYVGNLGKLQSAFISCPRVLRKSVRSLKRT